MPILYVHGVNVRSRNGFKALRPQLRKFVAPVIASDPDSVLIDDVFWGMDFGFQPTSGGISRPRTRLFSQGAGDEELPGTVDPTWAAIQHQKVLDEMPESDSGSSDSVLTSGQDDGGAAFPPVRLRDLNDDQLADVLAIILRNDDDTPEQRAELTFAADQLAHDPDFRIRLNAADSNEEELDLIFEALEVQVDSTSSVTGQGFSDWFSRVKEKLVEAMGRAKDLPAYAISVALAELRGPLNEAVSDFLGDVFVYLDKRQKEDDTPGPIPTLMLDKLKAMRVNQEARNNEPIVLVTHSMGGQIGYDTVTHFLPNDPALAGIKIDFWCAAASQVGFFEEAKLFIESKPEHKTGNPAPFPPSAHLGAWWNVWDYNDFLSFTAKDIILGVDDDDYDSGNSLLAAHGGYFERPSFFRKFARRLHQALEARGGGTV